jgi:Acetyl-coenzyme A transporter 1
MQNTLVHGIAGGKTGAVFVLVTARFILILLCATVKTTTDGWALNLLSTPSAHWATTTHAFGISSGYFISFNLFHTFSSASKRPDRAPYLVNWKKSSAPSETSAIDGYQIVIALGVVFAIPVFWFWLTE